MLVEYVNDNHYARFYDPCYHRYRERHFRILLDVKLLQKLWSMKCRSMVLGYGACLWNMLKRIAMQSFMTQAIIGTEELISVES